jgi:hypothetical protein
VLQWQQGKTMNTSIIFGSVAIILAGTLAAGQAFGETARPLTRQIANDQAVAEREKKKEELARSCSRASRPPVQALPCPAVPLPVRPGSAA